MILLISKNKGSYIKMNAKKQQRLETLSQNSKDLQTQVGKIK